MARPLLVLLLGAFGIACAAIFVRLALPAPPIVTGFWRLALATGALALVLAPRLRLEGRPPRALFEAGAAGVCFGLDLALWNTSLVETSVATATLLVNTTPVLVGAFSVLVLREKLGACVALGGALAFAGVAVLLGDDLDARASLRGDALALSAAVFYAGYLLWIQRARRALGAVEAVAVSGLASTLVLAAAAWLHGDSFTGFPLHSWAVFVASATVSHLAAVVGIVWALAHLSATFASIALLAQPVGTALLGWWWLGEALSPLQLGGGALVLAGISAASASGATRTPAPPTTGTRPADRARPAS